MSDLRGKKIKNNNLLVMHINYLLSQLRRLMPPLRKQEALLELIRHQPKNVPPADTAHTRSPNLRASFDGSHICGGQQMTETFGIFQLLLWN